MEIINPDNTKSNIDTNKLDDYTAMSLEKQEEFIKFCKQYGFYVWAFTLNSKFQGGGFYNLPEDLELKKAFILNMGDKIEQLTKGAFLLVPREFVKE